jgi:hypothetical protein
MSKRDFWIERYLAVVPEKLTAQDVRILLELAEEDTARLVEALTAFAESDEELEVVRCA